VSEAPSPSRPPEAPLPPGLRGILSRLETAEDRLLLHRPSAGPAGRLLRAVQVAVLAARRYREDHAGDRAAALAFSTLLSLLPLFLLGLAALGSADAPREWLEGSRRWLFQNMVPEAARDAEGTLDTALAALRDASRGLGIAGFLALLAAGWKLVATLDRTFQKIAGDLSLASSLRRLAGFWVTAALAPLLVAASLVVSGWVETLEARGLLPGDALPGALRWLVPLLPVWVALLLAYRFCAGTRIRWRSAVLGATLAAVALELLKAGFAAYLRHAIVTRTLLGGMGVLPVFLLWLYLSWVVILAGAETTLAADDYRATLRRAGLGVPDPGLRDSKGSLSGGRIP